MFNSWKDSLVEGGEDKEEEEGCCFAFDSLEDSREKNKYGN